MVPGNLFGDQSPKFSDLSDTKHALLELVTSEIFYRSNSVPPFAISGFNLTADEPRILSGYLVLEWRLETNEGRVKWRLLGSFGAVIHAVL